MWFENWGSFSDIPQLLTFSADITSETLKLGMVTKVKVFFLVLVYVFDFR